jgi:hypothetical protein
MYERFTDKARKIMQLANKEAQRFGHEYIGTEHILLGLIEDGRGVAFNVLKNLGVDLNELRFEVVRLVHRGPESFTPDKLPQTPRGKKVLEYAMDEARKLKHNYVGTEHILLGLLREEEGVASVVLKQHGLELNQVREEIFNLLGRGTAATPTAPRTPAPIEDLPDELTAAVLALDAEIERLRAEKAEAVANQEFDQAASLRDEEHKVRQRRAALFRKWLASRPIDRSWLSANDGAVLRLARTISEQHCWQLLPNLADALERAGCTDRRLIDHCREPGDHSDHCCVVDLLLAHAM